MNRNLKRSILALFVIAMALAFTAGAFANPDGSPYIRRADCHYIMVDFPNPPAEPETDEISGWMNITPENGFMKSEPIRFWKKEGLTYKYWIGYGFQPNIRYRLHGYIHWVGPGFVWTNEVYWTPCKGIYLPLVGWLGW